MDEFETDIPQETDTEWRKRKLREILKQQRDSRIAEPINNIQVRDKDRDRIQRAIDRWEEGGFGDARQWIMADNTMADLSKADLQSVLDAYDMRELIIFEQYQQMLARLSESDEPELIVWPDN